MRFLRGRLRVGQQARQPAGRQHLFQVEHQVFDANRPENRLIATALRKVAGLTREPGNWRLAHELEHQLAAIDISADIPGDLRRWSNERLMARYAAIRPWCELILGNRNPLSALGDWTGRSLLFPMERVFERYVEVCLRRRLPAGATLKTQAASEWLCRTPTWRMFQLKPDFVVEFEGERFVVDAKWKLIDGAAVESNYGLAQTDFYQLFAYGQRYLQGRGRMALIYPMNPEFKVPLDRFSFNDQLMLDVLPLDLASGRWAEDVLPGR